MRHLKPVLGALVAAVLVSSACTPAPAAPNAADLTAVVEGFYGAIKKGDSAGAMSFVAPDAVFLESGKLETRAEYETNHLPADISFEKEVNGKRHPMQVTFKDDAAWVIAITDYAGTFEGDPVDFISAQLVVLTRDAGTWRIRSIHWSSRRNVPI